MLDLPKLKRISHFGCELSQRWKPVLDAVYQRGVEVTT
jgi:hypothetical protein